MPTLNDIARNAAVDALAALCNSGSIVCETSGDVEVATGTFGATAFGAASGGTGTANAIAEDPTATGGVISHVMLLTSGAADIMDLTATVTSGGGDFEFSNLTIGANDTVSFTSLTFTQPAS